MPKLKIRISIPKTNSLGGILLTVVYTLAFVAVTGSLVFEYVFNLTPCYLCWWQRIFWYPMLVVLLTRIPLKYKLKLVRIFSGIGLLIALYHYYLQMAPRNAAIVVCSGVSDCSTPQIQILGFITIPFLSVTGFLVTIVLATIILNLLKQPKSQQ